MAARDDLAGALDVLLRFGAAMLTVLAPCAGLTANLSPNAASLVLTPQGDYLGVANYQSQFKKVWGF